MNYISLCSGIEAATVAWKPLGWKALAFSEIEKFPCNLLSHYYPDVQNLGDMTKIDGYRFTPRNAYYTNVDLVVGGTPCQGFSVSGLHKGLEDDRSRLALHFVRIVDEIRPKWLVWENVPGAFSTGGRRDFGTFVKALDECWYHLAWRVLDAQFFGVPQRRRRIFLVGHSGRWEYPAKVLFESEGLRGNTSESRKKKQDDTEAAKGCFGRGVKARSLLTNTRMNASVENFIYAPPVSGTLNESGAGLTRPAGQGNELDFCVADIRRLDNVYAAKTAHTSSNGGGISENIGYTLDTATGQAVYKPTQGVRRLTPVECERLQGFPDGYTNIGTKEKPTGDSLRYKALGNSMCVNVMRWIGERIDKVEKGIPLD